jgi:hypothetical protein
VRVFDDDDAGESPAQLLEDMRELARRLFGPAARGLDLLFQRFAAIEDGGQQRRQPRRDAADDIDEQRSRRPAGELLGGGKQRSVGLAGPIVRNALAAAQPQVATSVKAGGEGVDERGLADARLAGDEQHRTFAAAGGRQSSLHLLHVPLAPDAKRRRRRQYCGDRAARSVAGAGDQLDVADQAVAALPDGLDVARRGGGVGQESPQFPHALFRPVLAAVPLAPDDLPQFVGADHVAAAFEQMAQHRRRPCPHRHAPRSLPQRTARDIEAEAPGSCRCRPAIVRRLH